MINGQDYSHYQVQVNWPLAVSQGKQDWFYLKTSEGARAGVAQSKDDMYQTHRAGAASTGKPFGPYHFLTMFQKAELQVAWMHQCAPEPTPLPPILDAEQHYLEPDDMTVPLVNKRIHVHNWLLEAERVYGRRPIVYTGTYWWKDNIGDVPWAKDYQFIIANYLFFKTPIPDNFNIYWPGPSKLYYIPRENVIAWQWAGDIPNPGKYPWATGTQDFNVGDETAIYAIANQKIPLTKDQQFDIMWQDYLARHPGA